MHKTFLFTTLSVFVIFGMGGNVDKELDKMQGIQQQKVRGFFIQQKLTHPDSLFQKKELKGVTVTPKLEGLRLRPLPNLTGTTREPLVPLPDLSSNNMFISVKDYYKEKSELEAKIIKLEMNVEKLTGITASIQTSTVDNRAFLLKVIEIIVGALIGGGGIFGGVVALRKRKA